MQSREVTTRSRWSRQLLAAVNPGLGVGIGTFRRARAGVPVSAHGRTVALIGRVPGAGASTVAAVMALAAAGYTRNRVVVIDTEAAAASGVAGRLGARGDGRLPILLEGGDAEIVARQRIRAAGTDGTSVPVLELPAGGGSFTPQALDRTLSLLRYRSDLTIIDTPSDRSDPVFHAVLHLVDHVFVVLTADETAPDRLAATRRWLDATPGPPRHHDLAVVLVAPPGLRHRVRPARWRPEDLTSVRLGRDAGLNGGHAGRMSRRSMATGLDLVALASR